MIPQETVQQILDTAQIVDVVSDFVSLKSAAQAMSPAALSTTKKPPLFMLLPQKASLNASAAERPEPPWDS